MLSAPRIGPWAAWAASFAVLAWAAPAFAEETPRNMALELRFGFYAPDVDGQFRTATPYYDVFGDEEMFTFGLQLDYQVWQGFGSIGLGGSWHYGFVDGKSVDESFEATSDDTSLNMMPVNLTATYRFDYLARQFDVPLVPYVKLGLTAAFWWVTDAKDKIASYDAGSSRAQTGQGVTFGWHVGAGLQFLLDVLSKRMANQLDENVGINNTYLFGEWMLMSLNDFGSDESINLSDLHWWSFGMMFEF